MDEKFKRLMREGVAALSPAHREEYDAYTKRLTDMFNIDIHEEPDETVRAARLLAIARALTELEENL